MLPTVAGFCWPALAPLDRQWRAMRELEAMTTQGLGRCLRAATSAVQAAAAFRPRAAYRAPIGELAWQRGGRYCLVSMQGAHVMEGPQESFHSASSWRGGFSKGSPALELAPAVMVW